MKVDILLRSYVANIILNGHPIHAEDRDSYIQGFIAALDITNSINSTDVAYFEMLIRDKGALTTSNDDRAS